MKEQSPSDYSCDHVLPCRPETVVWGYLAPGLTSPLSIVSGDVVRIETVNVCGLPMPGEELDTLMQKHGLSAVDAMADMIDIMSTVTKGEGPHVLTGPIRLPAAKPGDVLAVEILDVTVREPAFGITLTKPGAGSLPYMVSEPWNHVQPIDLERGVVHFNDKIQLPLKPFMGTMGVAPTTRVSSIPPGPFGGNMDLKYLVPGSVVYLPVQVEGADFFVGDGHGIQGNGEVCLSALETSLTGTFRFELYPQRQVRWPMAETPDDYIVMGLDTDLNVAATKAVELTLDVLCWRTGLSRLEAYALASLVVDFEVTQIVDGVKGIHGRIPKRHFTDSPERWGPAP